jgi:hypothetical protein
MVHSVGSVGLARQDNSSDTNFYTVTCEITVKAIDDDQAINQISELILSNGMVFKWTNAHLVPKRMVV